MPAAPLAPIATDIDLAARRPHLRRRTLVQRALISADLAGLSLAYLISLVAFGESAAGDRGHPAFGLMVFVLSLPAWLLLGSVFGLYRQDDGRIGHSTVDDLFRIVQLVTLGAWMFFLGCWTTGISSPRPGKLIGFWLLAIALVTTSRVVARTIVHRSGAYLQRTVIVGGGDVGQLVARKLRQHREYRESLIGIVDDRPRSRRADMGELALLGPLEHLPQIVVEHEVDRVIVAFSNESDRRTVEVVRSLRQQDVQVDVVPRLYELVGPRVDVHTVEGLPLIGLPPMQHSSAALVAKRVVDVIGASLMLLVTAPLFGYLAWRVHRSSPGPVFFRQRRLGRDMREFTVLKFRTMRVDTDDREHRAYIAETMSARSAVGGNGLYKLDRSSDITGFGLWLRKTSLDELPQLINVLRGEMSLVGPRPCIPYETEHFEPHHFERFLMPQGLTGLWQVTARASASFGESLDMDVAYVRGWSLGLDLRLLFRTPVQLLRTDGTA
jgi:exopolysaccharide biosynthesis polyprenyl glycosylphosphotransferase